MQNDVILAKNNSLRIATQRSLRCLELRSQTASGQHTSPVVYPEKHRRGKGSIHDDFSVKKVDPNKSKRVEHRIDVGDEQHDLLGYEIFNGKLSLYKKNSCEKYDVQTSDNANLDAVDARLTSKALIWGSEIMRLEDVVSLSYCVGLRHFTVHSYPSRKGSRGLFVRSGRSRKDYRFLASNSEDALYWVNAFTDQHCFVNCLPHPMASKKQSSDTIFNEFPPESYIKSGRI